MIQKRKEFEVGLACYRNYDHINDRKFLVYNVRYPSLQSRYSATDDNTLVLYLKGPTATIASFAGEPKIIKF